MPLKLTFGAASRSSASLRWNSSRCSSGTSPTSRKLITCPSFIAAPFIVPSAVTICSAASMWRRSSAADLPSSERARFVARVPRCRAAWPAARLDTFAVRAIREVGILSLATTGWAPGWRLGRDGGVAVVGAAVRAPWRSRSAWRGVAVSVASAVGVSVACSVARRGRLLGAASRWRSGVGVSLSAAAEDAGACGRSGRREWPKIASSDAVTTAAPITAASRPGDERELPREAAPLLLRRAQAERVVLVAPLG